jgi:ribonuclease P protein component
MQQRHRLRRTADFDWLHRKGKRWFHSLAVLIVHPNEIDTSRFGFTASRRVGKAVERNRAKRQFREAVRKRLGEVKVGQDCLFIIRAQAISATSREVETAVEMLLEQADLMQTRPERDLP